MSRISRDAVGSNTALDIVAVGEEHTVVARVLASISILVFEIVIAWVRGV